MVALNMPNPFIANIITIFLGTTRQTYVVNNSKMFIRTSLSTLAFFQHQTHPWF